MQKLAVLALCFAVFLLGIALIRVQSSVDSLRTVTRAHTKAIRLINEEARREHKSALP